MTVLEAMEMNAPRWLHGASVEQIAKLLELIQAELAARGIPGVRQVDDARSAIAQYMGFLRSVRVSRRPSGRGSW